MKAGAPRIAHNAEDKAQGIGTRVRRMVTFRDGETEAAQKIMRNARERDEEAAQHGPLRILMRNGKRTNVTV
jgi:hypothetical protein